MAAPIAWPVLFVALAVLFAGGGALIATARGSDASTGATWGLYGGGILLLFLGAGPLGQGDAGFTVESARATAVEHHSMWARQSVQTLIVFAGGVVMIGLGLLVELYG